MTEPLRACEQVKRQHRSFYKSSLGHTILCLQKDFPLEEWVADGVHWRNPAHSAIPGCQLTSVNGPSVHSGTTTSKCRRNSRFQNLRFSDRGLNAKASAIDLALSCSKTRSSLLILTEQASGVAWHIIHGTCYAISMIPLVDRRGTALSTAWCTAEVWPFQVCKVCTWT